jgi:hypothetical protein
MNYRICWEDKHGAGHVEYTDDPVKAEKRISTLRCEATVWDNDSGMPAGGVEACDCDEPEHSRSIKWHWWLDVDRAPTHTTRRPLNA